MYLDVVEGLASHSTETDTPPFQYRSEIVFPPLFTSTLSIITLLVHCCVYVALCLLIIKRERDTAVLLVSTCIINTTLPPLQEGALIANSLLMEL